MEKEKLPGREQDLIYENRSLCEPVRVNVKTKISASILYIKSQSGVM